MEEKSSMGSVFKWLKELFTEYEIWFSVILSS